MSVDTLVEELDLTLFRVATQTTAGDRLSPCGCSASSGISRGATTIWKPARIWAAPCCRTCWTIAAPGSSRSIHGRSRTTSTGVAKTRSTTTIPPRA